MMFHSFDKDVSTEYFGGPEDILECHCQSLCKWLIPSLPKTTIQHFAVCELVHESSTYKGDIAKWKAFVADQWPSRPELMAFDYTSEFHSRDLYDPKLYGGPFISLGLFGQSDYYGGSICDLSMDFSEDFISNREYFARKPEVPWGPDLYDWFQGREDIATRGPVSGWSTPCGNLLDPY